MRNHRRENDILSAMRSIVAEASLEDMRNACTRLLMKSDRVSITKQYTDNEVAIMSEAMLNYIIDGSINDLREMVLESHHARLGQCVSYLDFGSQCSSELLSQAAGDLMELSAPIAPVGNPIDTLCEAFVAICFSYAHYSYTDEECMKIKYILLYIETACHVCFGSERCDQCYVLMHRTLQALRSIDIDEGSDF